MTAKSVAKERRIVEKTEEGNKGERLKDLDYIVGRSLDAGGELCHR